MGLNSLEKHKVHGFKLNEVKTHDLNSEINSTRFRRLGKRNKLGNKLNGVKSNGRTQRRLKINISHGFKLNGV